MDARAVAVYHFFKRNAPHGFKQVRIRTYISRVAGSGSGVVFDRTHSGAHNHTRRPLESVEAWRRTPAVRGSFADEMSASYQDAKFLTLLFALELQRRLDLHDDWAHLEIASNAINVGQTRSGVRNTHA